MTIKKRKTKRKIKRNTIKIGGMGGLVGMISQAKGKMAVVQSKMAEAKGKMDGVKGKFDEAKRKMDDVKSQAQSKMAVVQSKIAEAKGKFDEAKGKITEVQGQAQSKIAEAKGKLVDVQGQGNVAEAKGNVVKATNQGNVAQGNVVKATNQGNVAQGNVVKTNNITPLIGAATPLTSTIGQAQQNMNALNGKGNMTPLIGAATPLTSTIDQAQQNMNTIGESSNTQNKLAAPDDTSKVQEQIKKYTEKLKYFKGNPLFGFIIKTFARIYEDTTLLKQIYKSKYIQRNKYLRYINKLDAVGKQNYNDACCLIYKYYYKKIAENFSYLRESDYISINCKDKAYIENQIKLYNSTERHNSDHFNKIFYKQDQFSKIQDTGKMKEMKEKIEDAFIIPKNGIKNPLKYNYSYLILYILHDIHRNIDVAKRKETEKLKNPKKMMDYTPPNYDITKDSKCTPHTDADVPCDIKDIAISTIAGRSTVDTT